MSNSNNSIDQNTVSPFSDIPYNPKKSKNDYDLPFNINRYIKRKYDNEKKEIEMNKYQKKYLARYMNQYMARLKRHEYYYYKWINLLANQLKSGNKNIKIKIYGPNIDYNTEERIMMCHALKNFYYVLTKKGYTFSESEDIIEINDTKLGKYKERIKFIKIE